MGEENKPQQHRSLTVTEELYQKLDKIRQRRAKQLKVSNLSWNDFLTNAEETLRDVVNSETK